MRRDTSLCIERVKNCSTWRPATFALRVHLHPEAFPPKLDRLILPPLSDFLSSHSRAPATVQMHNCDGKNTIHPFGRLRVVTATAHPQRYYWDFGLSWENTVQLWSTTHRIYPLPFFLITVRSIRFLNSVLRINEKGETYLSVRAQRSTMSQPRLSKAQNQNGKKKGKKASKKEKKEQRNKL